MKSSVVAIVGSPNVGKSTIFNRLVGEKERLLMMQLVSLEIDYTRNVNG